MKLKDIREEVKRLFGETIYEEWEGNLVQWFDGETGNRVAYYNTRTYKWVIC